MANLLFATAGSKLEIGGPLAFEGTDFVKADFDTAMASAVVIGGTTNLGSAGDTSSLITSDQIAVSRTRKAKGTRNAGSMEILCDLDYSDPGQLALIAAEKTPHSYAFRLTFNDAPAGGTPSQRLFVALVMSVSEQLNEANNTVKLATTLEIDSNIVRVAAAEA
ncbi:hypothetical protein [Consotaella salsifontis]|uniref:Phage tail tube protein n=1 Tax=Consotaella salsifontis TaxID=1365950 RepID=A0A1T4SDQ3_9HYPH|nr:hypothetical protein [Consotaella salsifontis]SKA26363.1 hypothetical protein SAMN05428963_11069 [Consotaella salsifontis]